MFSDEHTAWSPAFTPATLSSPTLHIPNGTSFPAIPTRRLHIFQFNPSFTRKGEGDQRGKEICPRSRGQRQSLDQNQILPIPPASHSSQDPLIPLLRKSQSSRSGNVRLLLWRWWLSSTIHLGVRWTPCCWTETPNALCEDLKMKTGNGWGLELTDLVHIHTYTNTHTVNLQYLVRISTKNSIHCLSEIQF